MTVKVRLFLLGKELEPAKAGRDLGVMLDSNLTYKDEHNVSTVSSCISRLGQINRVKDFVHKRASIIIINVLVLSKLFIALLFGAILLKLIWTSSKQYRISLVAFCAALKNSIT